jgi:alkylation response protein AidB-like acyl-CoA dehydrogenase
MFYFAQTATSTRARMDLRFTPPEEAFRKEAREWLESRLSGQFRGVRGRGGPGDEGAAKDERVAWERALGAAGWACVGWPKAYGGREASLVEQVIFHEEYARARAPGRLGHIGEGLLGPTLIAFGTEAQRQRFLPPIVRGEELWCQGYSEPNAGSDLANVQTRAVREESEWVITGQKVWTSLAHWADWCFVLCRTDPDPEVRHRGLSYLLVPMRTPGIEVRPIVQMTGGEEFNEVFFDRARTSIDNVVGPVGGGWKVAMATLAFERGASTLGQQLAFENELNHVITVAKTNGAAREPALRQRIAQAWMGLKIMRLHALRTLSLMQGGELAREAMVSKLYWATWHRELGKLAMDVLGAEAEVTGAEASTSAAYAHALTELQRLFLFTRADTIYAGSNEIQKNIIGERALGLPPEPRVARELHVPSAEERARS